MANFFQKIFYNDYQCQILDLINEYDVHHRQDDWTMLDGTSAHCCEESYSIRDKKFFIVATRLHNSAKTPANSFRLHIEDHRPGTNATAMQLQQSEKFAKRIYYKMLEKYQDTHNVR